MPKGNGQGPNGRGPMTGRAAGFCANAGMPGYMNAPGNGGSGMGGGRERGGGFGGGGRGWRIRVCTTGAPAGLRGGRGAAMLPEPTPGEELEILKRQAEAFESGLAGLRQRIEELQQKQPKP